MGKKKVDEPEAVEGEPGAYRIEYRQGDEDIVLTFHDEERRDMEFARLHSMHVFGIQKTNA